MKNIISRSTVFVLLILLLMCGCVRNGEEPSKGEESPGGTSLEGGDRKNDGGDVEDERKPQNDPYENDREWNLK